MALDGLSVPVPTIFGENEQIDAGLNARFTRKLCDAHVDHVFVLGTLGEFPLVTSQERPALLEAVIESLGWKTDGWVGCGAPSTAQAVANAVQAEEAGAAAVVAVPPYYLSPTEASIKHYFRAIKKAVGVPLLCYNIPAHVGYALSPALVHELAREKVLAGMKDTAGSIDSVTGFLHGAPEGFAVFPGDDLLAGPSIAGGAVGAVMGSANVVPRLGVELIAAARKGDTKRVHELEIPLKALLTAMEAGPFPSVVKYLAQRLREVGAGYREPYSPLTTEEQARVDAALAPAEPLLRPFLA
ncbi:MAG: dihydrodipicolinate synthase family protein [Thermoplasmata archaeon]|nr:dihydrodipicolinate synthase family protein [Thermoplasmata archaeon]